MQKKFIRYVWIIIFTLQLQAENYLEVVAESLIKKTCQEQIHIYNFNIFQELALDINNQSDFFVQNVINKVNTIQSSEKFKKNNCLEKKIIGLLTAAIQIIDTSKKSMYFYNITIEDQTTLITIFEKKQQILQAKLQQIITIQTESQSWFNKKTIQYIAIGIIVISCANLLDYFYQYEPKAGKLYDAKHHHQTIQLTPLEQKQAIEHPFFQKARQYLLECLNKQPNRTEVLAKIKDLKPILDPKLHSDYIEAFNFIEDHQNFSRFDLLRKFGIFNLQEKAYHFRNLGLHILNSHPESQKKSPDKICWKTSDFPLKF